MCNVSFCDIRCADCLMYVPLGRMEYVIINYTRTLGNILTRCIKVIWCSCVIRIRSLTRGSTGHVPTTQTEISGLQGGVAIMLHPEDSSPHALQMSTFMGNTEVVSLSL